MKNIKLSNGDFAIVDDEDFELLDRYIWHSDGDGYVVRASLVSDPIYKKRSNVRMHRIIIGEIREGLVVDHINGNKLDNRRSNLRTATLSQNQWNRGVGKNSKSGVTGVSYDSKRRKWCVQICVNNISKNIGRFAEIEDAIKARKQAEEKYFGEYARK